MFESDRSIFADATNLMFQVPLSCRDVPSAGLLARTRVETDKGWWRIEELAEGDRVRVRDGSLKPVQRIERAAMAADHYDGDRHVLLVPVGVLGNNVPFFMLPDQRVLFGATEGDAALVPVKALAGRKGITPLHLPMATEVFTLHFATEEIVPVNEGTLAWCPADRGAQSRFPTAAGENALRLIRSAGLGHAMGRRIRVG